MLTDLRLAWRHPLVAEGKADSEMTDNIVVAKADAAGDWAEP